MRYNSRCSGGLLRGAEGRAGRIATRVGWPRAQPGNEGHMEAALPSASRHSGRTTRDVSQEKRSRRSQAALWAETSAKSSLAGQAKGLAGRNPSSILACPSSLTPQVSKPEGLPALTSQTVLSQVSWGPAATSVGGSTPFLPSSGLEQPRPAQLMPLPAGCSSQSQCMESPWQDTWCRTGGQVMFAERGLEGGSEEGSPS